MRGLVRYLLFFGTGFYRGGEGRRSRQSGPPVTAQKQFETYGHTVVNEFPAEKYIDEKLHRSTSGATLLIFRRLPSSLGGGMMPDPAIIVASVRAPRM